MLIHTVSSGETLWQIASRYNVPMEKIISVNGLASPNQLLIGQSLVIPTEDILYTVKSGDTLWKIAGNFKTTIQAILQSNRNISPANIYPGLKLIIPAPRHTVLRGETLSLIAQRYGISLASLIKANQIQNPNLIYPGTVLVIPIKSRPVIDVNGYIYQFGSKGAATVRDEGVHLTYLSPFAYKIREDGSLDTINDTPLIDAALSVRAVPVMSITNFTSTELGHNLAHVVLSNPGIQDRLLSNIINIMAEKGYRGINIDFENVLPQDRVNYNEFLQRTVDRLHREGYFVSTALAPKTGPTQQGLLYEAHDYPAHGRIVDFVVLMTYEWGYRKGPPQAISPLDQIKRVLDYAVTVIPRKKILFGFQIYARDWLIPFKAGQEAETFSNQEAVRRAVKHGARIQFDTKAQSPFFRYTDEQGRGHEVWFEDARSAQAKFDTVKQYGLMGISYWTLGYPFPQNWALLEDNFTVRKLI